ncbi:glycosyltransferase [Rubrobacter indicoceani]|uniref:glycosyltransferase n=1 Tax=Rubrobacter indicoceani TaxID=2051957 RepID=UPI000E5BBC49|nr:glycosyltransferase [Rubrobacter indicoceani]
MSVPDRPVRVLQIVEGMYRAGLETWLMHVLRHIDRDRFRMDFLVQDRNEGHYDAEIRSLGSQVIHCKTRKNPLLHTLELRDILRRHGPYDVVHSHFHYYNGYALGVAKAQNVPIRVSHSHSDISRLDEAAGLPRKAFVKAMRHLLYRNATAGLAVSRGAAYSLFGPGWERDPRWRILFPSIVPERFHSAVDRPAVRRELGIPEGAFVVGHVGRFSEPKNHGYLLEIAAALFRREPNARLVLVGEGDLRAEVEAKIRRLGIVDKVILTGSVPDPERLMRSVMDVFMLPSLYEGLPLVGIEAQAAGLPFFISDVVSEDVDAVPALIHRLSISEPPETWARAILASREKANPVGRAEALRLMEESAFNIEHTVRQLEAVYAKPPVV